MSGTRAAFNGDLTGAVVTTTGGTQMTLPAALAAAMAGGGAVQGPIGPAGPIGPIGPTGLTGPIGLTGPAGSIAPFTVANSYGLSAGTATRSSAARFGDVLNPADFGAPLTGLNTASDLPGINAMIAAGPATGARYSYPVGAKLFLTANPSYTGLGCHDLNGATSGGGDVLQGAGKDMYTTISGGGLVYGRTSTNPTAGGSVLTISGLLNSDITLSGNAVPIWSPFSIVAGTNGAVRNNTAIFAQSTTLTLNTPGGTLDGIAGSFLVTKAVGSKELPWALLLQSNDRTPGPSSVWGGMTSIEADFNINGLDDGGSAFGYVPSGAGARTIFDLVLASNNTASPNSVGYMMRFGISGRTATGTSTPPGTYNSNVYAERGIAFVGYARTSFIDLTMGLGLPGSPCFSGVTLPANMSIAFDGVPMPAATQTAPAHTLLFNSTSGDMELQKNGAVTVGFTDSGGVVTTGLNIDASTQSVSPPASGGAVSVPANCARFILAPNSAVTSVTITGPAAPTGLSAGESCEIEIMTEGYAISGITWAAGSGVSLGGASLPTSMAVGTRIVLIYVQGTGRFYHVTTV